MHARVSDLLAALAGARVDSRARLAAKWAQSPAFLQRELGAWLQQGGQQALSKLWQTLREEAAASPS